MLFNATFQEYTLIFTYLVLISKLIVYRYFAIVTMRQYSDDVGLANNVIAMVEMKFMVSNDVKLPPNDTFAILVNDKIH